MELNPLMSPEFQYDVPHCKSHNFIEENVQLHKEM